MAVALTDSVPLNGDPRIDGLVQGGRWYSGASGPTLLTYSLDYTGFQAGLWTADRIAMVEQALQAWENVANVDFQRVGIGGNLFSSTADLAIGLSGTWLFNNLSAASLGFFPDVDYANEFLGEQAVNALGLSRASYPRIEGDIVIDDGQTAFSTYWFAGGAGYEYLLHEIGHALGLKHPFDDGGNDRPTFFDENISQYDDGAYTVMSYNAASSSLGTGNGTTPMPYDILAIQHVYGANTTYQSGNDTYFVNSAVLATIWDTGGIDTIDASFATRWSYIDLRPGAVLPGDSVSSSGYGVAFGVTLENAIGSRFNDEFYGNDADNVFDGRGGNDTLRGGEGDDTFVFGRGSGTDYITWMPTGNETGFDRLQVGVTPGEVRLASPNSGSEYVLKIKGTSDNITWSTSPSAGLLEQITFSDGTVWNGADFYSHSLNAQPTASIAPPHAALGGWARLSDFIKASDAEGDAITGLAVRDTEYDPNAWFFNSAGYLAQATRSRLWFNGSYSTFVSTTADQLSNIWIQGGTQTGTHQFEVTFRDEFGAGLAIDPTGFTFTTRAQEHAPVATPASGVQGMVVGNSVAATTLFGTSDADGDAIVTYRFWDSAGGGQFKLNGVAQPAGQNIDLSEAQLANTVYAAAVGPGTETVWVQVYDGTAWSAWASWQMQTQRASNALPVVHAPLAKGLAQNEWAWLPGFVSVTDGDLDPMQRFELRDGNSGAGSARLWAGAYVAQGGTLTVTAADLANAWVQGGAALGSQSIAIRAYDGYGWGEWESFDLATRVPNRAPVAAAQNKLVLLDHYWPLGDLVTVSDADANRITEYELWDAGPAVSSGYFTVNGVKQAAGQAIPVAAPLFDSVRYLAGSVLGPETLYVRAFDGDLWSAWQPWTMDTVATVPPGSSITVTISTPDFPMQSFSPIGTGNQPPVVTPIPATLADRHPIAAGNLFSVADPEMDPITQYEFYAPQDLWLAGVRQGNDVVAISASQLGQLVYRAPQVPGTVDTLQVRAFDGFQWSAWSSTQITIVPNHAPQIALTSTTVGVDKSLALTTLWSFTDAENDSIEGYELFDTRTSDSSGHFALDGTPLAAGEVIALTGAQAANATYVGGFSAGEERLWMRAYDGYDWSAWQPFTVATQNRAPAVIPTGAVQAVAIGNTLAADAMFDVLDPDSGAMTVYRFWDSAGGGQFKVNGIAQAAGQSIDVGAAQLANTVYAAGAVAGIEQAWVQVYDGAAWSQWASWQMQTQRTTNVLPVVSVPAVKNVLQNEWVWLPGISGASDADLDSMVRYELRDGNATAGSAVLWAGGYKAQGVTVSLTAAEFANAWLQGGANLGSDTIEVRANDGFAPGSWSEWKSFNLATRLPNRAPVAVPTAGAQSVQLGQTVAAATLFHVDDLDGDEATIYRFWDSAGGGQLRLNGVAQPAGQGIDLSAAQLASTVYAAGAAAGKETVWLQVYDGAAWSGWASWQMMTLRPNNVLPVVNAPAARNVLQSEWAWLSGFVNTTDADQDPIVRYELRDGNSGANSARLWVGGYKDQGGTFTVEAADFANAWAQGGSGLGSDTIEIRANDGYGWGEWESFSLNTRLPNRAPMATPASAVQGVPIGQTLAAGSLFTPSDADNDPITLVRFWDSAGGGQFRVNGAAQPPGQNIDLTLAQLANTVYAAGPVAGNELVWVQVYDGAAWSQWASWQMQSQRTSNSLPVVSAPAVKNVTQSEWVLLPGLIGVTDADIDSMVRYELRDVNGSAGSALLWVSGYKAQGATVTLTAAEFANAWVQGGTLFGTDTIQIRANDGYTQDSWSDWKSFNLVTRQPNRAPVATPSAAAQGLALTTSVAASTLFSVVDADGDQPTIYRFWDGGAGIASGYFTVNGAVRGAQQNFDVAAADLANTRYAAGLGSGTETLYVQVYDGSAWSPWTNWQMTSFLPQRYTEHAGGKFADSFGFPSQSDHIYFGLGGDDTFHSIGSDPVMMGGAGGDTYIVDTDSVGVVYETGASAGDSLNFGVLGTLSGAFIDNRHLLLLDEFDFTFKAVVLIDWKDADNRLETYYLGSALGTKTYEQFVQFVDSKLLPNSSWEDVDENTPRMNESLEFYRQRAQELAANHAPVVTAVPNLSPSANRNYSPISLFSASDSDGDLITKYEFTDLNAGGGSLILSAGNATQPAGVPVVLDSWSQAMYVTGALGSSDTLTVRVFDGTDWSAPVDIVLTPANHKPVIQAPTSLDVNEGHARVLSVFLGTNDPDGDALTAYEFTDPGAGGGYLTVNGVQQAATTPVTLTASQYFSGNVSYVGGTPDSSETITVRVSDGTEWTTANITFNSTPNHQPSVFLTNGGTATLRLKAPGHVPEGADERKRLDQLFAAGDTDGDSITQYEFTDQEADGGFLLVNNVVQSAGSPTIVAAANLGNTFYVAGGSAVQDQNHISVRAYDGFAWSESKTLTFTQVENNAPLMAGSTIGADSGLPGVMMNQLFTASDGNDDALRYEVRSTLFQGFGTASVVSDENGIRTWSIPSLTQFGYLIIPPGETAEYTISARAFDGVDWSDWVDSHVTVTKGPSVKDNNDTLQTALVVGANSTTHDWLGPAGYGNQPPVADHYDYFRFHTDSAGTIRVQVNGVGPDQQVKLTILSDDEGHYYDNHGSPIFAAYARNNEPLDISLLSAPAGDYYVWMQKNSDNGTYYNLTLSTGP